MRQLTSLDAQFLALETPRQYGHTSGVVILDPSTAPGGTLDLAAVQQLILDRLHLLPPFRWRLAEVPLGLDYAYWVDDPDFDIDFHVRELALVPPGTADQLAEQVARIFSRPLDRSRPLWELYLIHGLEGGRVAVMSKIHHAVIDGMSGAEILGVLLDLTPEVQELPPPPQRTPARMPGDVEMLMRGIGGLTRYPLRALRSIPRTLPNIEDVGVYASLPGSGLVGSVARGVRRVLGGDSPDVVRSRLVPPRTSFNGRVSPHRRLALGRIPLDRVKDVKNLYGVTVNDVVVSICAGAVRRWLLEHDELPEEPLVAQIPVSVRTQEQQGTFGNRILLMSAPLFTDEPDPVARLARTHEALADMKDRHRALPADLLQDANHFIPPAMFSRAARLTFALSSRVRPTWNLVISNVPGPQIPLYLAGARIESIYPVSVVTDGMGLNITVMSYNGELDFGIVADREMVPEVRALMRWIEASLAELAAPLDAAAVAEEHPRRGRLRSAADDGAEARKGHAAKGSRRRRAAADDGARPDAARPRSARAARRSR